MTDLYLMAHRCPASRMTRARLPRGRSLMTYAAPGDGLCTADVYRVLSGTAAGPRPHVRTGGLVANAQLFPVADIQLSTARAQFGEPDGELATVPEPMWLCATPRLCDADRHVCNGVLGPAFDTYDTIHIVDCQEGAEPDGSGALVPARKTHAFLAGDYAATRAHWMALDQAQQQRCLAHDGVALWYQVHGCHLRASSAQGEFHRLHDFQCVLPREHREALLAHGDAGRWPWAADFMAQVRAEEAALTALERDFDTAAWNGLSTAGQLRALEIYREWGAYYLDSVQDSIIAAGLVVPGRLTPGMRT